MESQDVEATLDSLVNIGEDTAKVMRIVLDMLKSHERRIRELEARVA